MKKKKYTIKMSFYMMLFFIFVNMISFKKKLLVH